MSSRRAWSLLHAAILVVAALGGLTGNSPAVVVAVPAGTYLGNLRGEEFLPLDLDGNGTTDVGVTAGENGYFHVTVNSIAAGSGVFAVAADYPGDVETFALYVPFGTRISIYDEPFASYGADWMVDFVDPVFGRAGALLYATIGSGIIGVPFRQEGLWRPGRQACGVRFLDSEGRLHYGWLDITLVSSFRMILNGWGWETEPDTYVTPYEIPEPGTSALLVLSGSLLLRRKRPGIRILHIP